MVNIRLTHKVIARMAGYRTEYVCGKFRWLDNFNNDWGSPRDTEAEAWEACCIDNGLIED